MTAFIAMSALAGLCALALGALYKLNPPKPQRRYFYGIDPASKRYDQTTIVKGYVEEGVIHIEEEKHG